MATSSDTSVQKSRLSKNGKIKTSKILPTERISFAKQLDLLRAYAVASGPTNKPVTNNDVSPIVKMTSSTVSISNAFFADAGLLLRSNGGYIPAPDVISFNHAFGWNPETAPYKLAPLMQESWFAKAILPKANFRAITEDEAIQDLSEAAAVGPEKRAQLEVLLSYLAASGLIIHENGQVIAKSNTDRQAIISGNGELSRSSQSMSGDGVSDQKEREIPKNTTVATTFAVPTEGTVRFNVSVCVDMAEFKGWEGNRISAFFAGIAQVLAAKAAVEKSSNPA